MFSTPGILHKAKRSGRKKIENKARKRERQQLKRRLYLYSELYVKDEGTELSSWEFKSLFLCLGSHCTGFRLAFHHNEDPKCVCPVKRKIKIIVSHLLQARFPPPSSLPACLFTAVALLSQRENQRKW